VSKQSLYTYQGLRPQPYDGTFLDGVDGDTVLGIFARDGIVLVVDGKVSGKLFDLSGMKESSGYDGGEKYLSPPIVRPSVVVIISVILPG
jgi:hypothetical protein